jgi:hypothetical protein
MATMSHTPAQRKAWHLGKAKHGESSFDAFVRCRRKKIVGGAATPFSLKGGLRYQALPKVKD